jgi:predicted O-methyltransferase YrrM
VDTERWAELDRTLERHVLLRSDAALDAVAQASADAGLPPIAVSPLQGKLLHLLARLSGARRVLEIGTLGGYSTIWLARALPDDGELVTLEVDPHHADVARGNLRRAGLAERVRVVVGAALDTMASLDGPFDLVFVDADKRNGPEYVRRALELTRPGGAIVVDNVVRRAASDDLADQDVAGTHALLQLLRDEPRLDATVVQTVGRKGWDGFVLALVTG